MTNKETGGPAFPVTSDNYANSESTGMTLRDYFAAKAMVACYQQWLNNGWNVPEHEEVMNNIADEAYLIADAMLKAREQ